MLHMNSARALTRHDHPGGEVYPVLALLAHPVPGDAGVVPQVRLDHGVDPQLGPVVEHPHPPGGGHVAVALEPDDLGGGGAASLRGFYFF